MSFIAVPLKKTYEVDLVKSLKDVLSSQYSSSDDPEELKRKLKTLNTMRSNCTSKTLDIKHESSLEMLQKYYDQLASLEAKCPSTDVAFKWKDAFDRGGIVDSFFASSSSLTIPSIAYEKVCILFNIGAIQSQLAAEKANEGLNNDLALRMAAKYFQGASGIFQALKHTASSAVGSHDLLADMQNETLNVLQNLMLAQAQETFFYKATSDNMKEAVIARIASQCEEHYADVWKQLQIVNKFSWPEKEWFSVIGMKQVAFRGIAEFYQGLVCKQNKEFGEQVCRMQKAVEGLKDAESKGLVNFLPAFKDHLHKAMNALEEAKKDNDFIYHAKVPDHKSIAGIGKANLAKPTNIPDRFLPESGDLFDNLLPVGMQQAVTKLDQRKQEIVNAEIASLRETTQTLNAILSSLNLPAALEDASGVEVPQSLRDKSNAVIAKGGYATIQKLLSELPDLLERNKEILNETERTLNAEEESDETLRAQFKEKWTRTPSNKLNQNWKEHIGKYKSIISNAITADNKVRQKFSSHKSKIELLSSTTESSLSSAIPSGPSGAKGIQNLPVVAELKRLMDQVEALKNEREVIESEFKNCPFDNMKSKFLSALVKDGAMNELALSTEALGEVYGPLQKQVRESKERQEKLLADIQRANEEFVKLKGNTSSSEREVFLSELATAHDVYMDLLSNLQEGTKFYNDLTQLLVNLQTKIEDFCFARKAEREELCKDLQNQIVARPTPPAPAAPTYHANESSGASQAPPTAPNTSQPAYPFNQSPYGGNPYQQPPQQPYGYYPPPPLPTGYNPYATPQYQMPPQQGYPAQPTGYYPYQQATQYPQYPYPQQQQPPHQ